VSNYKIEIEIYEGKGGQQRRTKTGRLSYSHLVKEGICAWMYRGDGEQSYQRGRVFAYPEEAEKLCPWLLDSMSGFIRELSAGKTLGWRYTGTPYEKVIDPEGTTTEFARCPDPTDCGIVVKLIRTKIAH
jgi:hypothetical protein